MSGDEGEGYPHAVPRPGPREDVQVMMTEQMARSFETWCLSPSGACLGGPLLFSEEDIPTYVIVTPC